MSKVVLSPFFFLYDRATCVRLTHPMAAPSDRSRSADPTAVRGALLGPTAAEMDLDDPTTTIPAEPLCAASLLTAPEQDPGFTCEPYPLFPDKEPPVVAVDAATASAMNVPGSQNEIKDPQDYVPAQQQHNLLLMPRCYISTDASADREKEVLDVANEAKVVLFDLERNRHTVGGDWDEHKRKVTEAQQLLATAEAKLVKQSTELLPDRVEVEFDPDATTFTIKATYTNPTLRPISATATIHRTEKMRLVRSEVVQHYYKGKVAFKPNKVAKQEFEELCASKTSGASLQMVDRAQFSETANVPSHTPWLGASRRRAEFTVVWVVACEDADEQALLLPHVTGKPRRLAYDFAVQLPFQDGSSAYPVTLKINPSKGTKVLDVPSRAAAALDAERRGVPTWWVKPDAYERTHELTFSTPSRHPPCVRFRFTNEGGGDEDDDFALESLGGMSLQPEGITAKVLSWAATGTEECVARVQIRVPRTLAIGHGSKEPEEHEIALVGDLSYSMGSHDGGSPHSRRELVGQEQALLCDKLLKFPEAFKKAGIVGPDDTFSLTIVGFHSSASFTCERIPLEREHVEAAVAQFRNRTDGGGTVYTSWAQLLNSTPRAKKLALCLLTDGALWDQAEFTAAYERLQNKVDEFAACAVGCGAWANHATVKLVATIEKGETLITTVDNTVSCESARLVGRCLASVAAKQPITIPGKVLSHTGVHPLPGFLKEGHGHSTVYQAGLGATIECTVSGTYQGANVRIPDFFVGHNCDNPERVAVQGVGARHDPPDVLRNLDPLFVGKGVALFKDDGLRTAALLGIGMHCKTTTSEVMQLTTYQFEPKDDNSLKKHTRAVVPAFDPAQRDDDLAWLRPPPYRSDPALVVTKYEHKGNHYVPPVQEAPEPCGDEPAFRSLGAEHGSSPDYTSCSAGADSAPSDGPKYRGLSADSGTRSATRSPAPAPAPKKAKKAEVDETVKTDGTPSFEVAAKPLRHERLAAFLNDPALAFQALEDVVGAFAKMGKALWELKKAASHSGDPMVDIVDAVCDAVAGPSLEDVLARILPVVGVLGDFALRFHVNVDLDLHNDPIKSDTVDVAILRVEYLHKIAQRVLKAAEAHRRQLWRGVLITSAVSDTYPTTGGSQMTGCSFVWERENIVHYEPVNQASDEGGIREAMRSTVTEMTGRFNEGGYAGGHWASKILIEGPKPPEVVGFTVELKRKFVLGEFYDEGPNVLVPMRDALDALRL